MTTQKISKIKPYISIYNNVLSKFNETGPSFLNAAKTAAFESFCQNGFPFDRKGNEDWKYTDVNKILEKQYTLIEETTNGTFDYATLIPTDIPAYNTKNRLFFINGEFKPELSNISNDSVVIDSLKKGLEEYPSIIAPYLEDQPANKDSFINFNTLFFQDGVFIYAPPKTTVTNPIQIINIEYQTGTPKNILISPRILVILEPESTIEIEEYCFGSNLSSNLINSVSKYILCESSKLHYSRMQDFSESTNNINNTEVILNKYSTFNSFYLDLGGNIVRNNLNIELIGEESSANMVGLYLPNNKQHVDNQIIVDHKSPYTYSDQTYKGILNGSSKSVFHGSIIVRENSVKVNASQEDKNLLLSDQSEAYTKPAFWIYCDDIMCKHGAACGQIDKESLFYLTSRGISSKEAKQLLVRGFAADIFNKLKTTTNNKVYIEEQVVKRLDSWL